MSLSALNQVDGLQELLNRCQRVIRVHAFFRGLSETLCVLIAGIVCACALDYLIVLPGLVRLGLLAGTVLITGVVIWKRLLRPVFIQTPAEELGAAVDLQFPDLQESVATLISLQSPDATLSEVGSSLMGQRLQQHVQTRIRSVQPSAIIQPGRTFKRCALALISLIAISIPVLLWPSGAQLLARRLFTPFANLAAVSNLYFEVPNANRIEATHADVQFVAIPQWRTGIAGALPADVELEMVVATGQQETLAMTFDETQAQYSVVLSDIRDSLRYRIRGGGTASEWFTLQVADRPRLLSALLQETPPAYTGRPVETFDGVVGDIPVFERSQIEIRLTFNKPAKSVRIDWKNWTPLESAAAFGEAEERVAGENQALLPEELAAAAMAPAALRSTDPPVLLPVLSDNRLEAVFQFEAQGSGQFEFFAEDELGLTNSNETTRRLIVSTDTPPRLTVTGVADGLDVRPDDVVPLNCRVVDDLGVGQLELHVQKNKDAAQIQPAEPLDQGAAEVSHEYLVNLTTLNLIAGDTVTFRVRAADDRPVPGPQVVWQGPFTITIADNAEPLGQKPLREADQQLVDALRKMEEQLQMDANNASDLKDKADEQWDEATQQDVRALSEKEQTQGNELRQLAGQTAEHPLMQKQAQKLTELAQQLRQNVPERLNQAASADRETAAQELQKSEAELNTIRQELHTTVDEIEKLAQLEQELAELNRLALEADQLAKDSEQLREEQAADRPEEGQTPAEQRAQQAEKQMELQRQQQQLSDDLARLLQRKQELLQSAREAQLEQAAEIAAETRQLAQQQQRLAEGVSEEARDAARDAQTLADELEKSRREANQLNEQIQQNAPDVARPELQPLDDAIAKLREGNLFTPQQKIEQTREQLNAAAAKLNEPPTTEPPTTEPTDPAATPDEAPRTEAEKPTAEQSQQRQELASRATQVNDRLKELGEQLEKMAAERGAKEKDKTVPDSVAATNPQSPDTATDAKPGDTKPADSKAAESNATAPVTPEKPAAPADPAQAIKSADVGRSMLQQLDKMEQAAREQANALKTDSAAGEAARQHADEAAQQAREAVQNAQAGKFNEAAGHLRKAGSESQTAADDLNENAAKDKKSQLQQQGENFNRMAEATTQLQQDNAAQVAAQQDSQRDVAQATEELPQSLKELAERLNLPALGLQHLAQPAQDAATSAQEAAASGEQAAEQLDQTQMQQAGQSAQQSAEQLNRAAQLAQQAAEGHRDPNALIPSEVGESVNDALHSLQKASELMNAESQRRAAEEQAQQAGQPGKDGQAETTDSPETKDSKDGQPGEQGSGNNPSGQEESTQSGSKDGQADGQKQAGSGEQDSGKPGSGEPGSGEPGEGKSQPGQGGEPGQASNGKASGQSAGNSAQQLANAARALQSAAKRALPNQFSPGQLNSDGSTSSGDPQGKGSSAQFDGQNPKATSRKGTGRKWGQLQDELDSNIGDAGKEVLDNEYSELIRRYRRDLARSADKETATKTDPQK